MTQDVTREEDKANDATRYVDQFKVIRLIGEGGFGEVFEALQTHPIRRRVALKLLRKELASREVIARFESERQALALMDHPHIAHVFDAGTFEGQPYFAMEYVQGSTITEYCDTHRFTIGQRLGVFRQVCEAVQHAHSKGIVHRDIKPGNILVSTQDGQPFARVIDFGIAKALGIRSWDQSAVTQLHQVVGTPLYMSPEQALGNPDIDTRSDVYSLGVVLYELLTGTTPVESSSLRNAAIAEMQRMIVEVEPQRPSQRLASSFDTLNSAATRCNTEPGVLAGTVRGELDWIVMRALDKERQRRYETPSALADDIQRFLTGEPVSAAPPSRTYRLRKFIRRNKLMTAAVAFAAGGLMIGSVLALWQWNEAAQRASELEEILAFQERLLGDSDSALLGQTLRREIERSYAAKNDGERASFSDVFSRIDATDVATQVLGRGLLDPAADGMDARFEGRPLIEARLRAALADAYAAIGDLPSALRLRERALQLHTTVQGASHRDTVRAALALAVVTRQSGDVEAAQRLATEQLKIATTDHPNDDELQVDAHLGLGDALQDLAQFDGAIEHYRRALELGEKRNPYRPHHVASLHHSLGYALMLSGNNAAARTQLERALRLLQQLHGVRSIELAPTMAALGEISLIEGDMAAAEPLYRDVLAIRTEQYGSEHPSTVMATNDLGVLLHQQQRYDEALVEFVKALALNRKLHGQQHAETASAENNLCVLYQSLKRLNDARAHCVEAHRAFQAVFSDAHPSTVQAGGNLLMLHINSDDSEQAYRLALKLEGPARKILTGDLQLPLSRLLLNIGRGYSEYGRLDEARTRLAEGANMLRNLPGATAADLERCDLAIDSFNSATSGSTTAALDISCKRE